MNTQFITTAAGEELAVLPRAEYERLLALAEDASDIAAGREARDRIARGEDEAVPAAIADRLVDGENPVRVWREHRGMTVTALAGKAAISAAYLSQIESGRRTGSLAVMRRIADALEVSLDDL